jgi:hypothetical protein
MDDEGKTGIERAVAIAGSQTALARDVSALADLHPDWDTASQQLVHWWLSRGFVPIHRAPQVAKAVNELVTARELIDPKLLEVAGVGS